MNTGLKLLVAIAGALIAPSTVALACSCLPPEPRTLSEIRAAGDKVILGRVLSATKTGGGDINAGNMVYRIDVEAAFNLPDVRSITVRSAPNGALCGIRLRAGSLEILFIDDDGGEFWAGLCGNIFRPRTEEQARQWWRDLKSGATYPPRE